MDQISRKDFFKEMFGFFKDEVEKGKSGVSAKLQYVVPPPGAASVQNYIQSCDKCFDCVAACPPMALEVCRDRQSELYDYPVIEPGRMACMFCEDYPCISACHTDALDLKNIGTLKSKAVIIENFCLAYQDHFCMTCISSCPPEYKAIRLNADGLPEIDPLLCTGCGICAQACPAPKKAIAFILE